MEDVDATIDEETKSLFNASIQNALLKEAQEKNIHKLLEDYNNIQLQCKILREPLNIFKRKYEKLNIGQCGICYSNSISIAIEPCGHTVCELCAA